MSLPGVTDEVLTAFADGELAPEEEALVRAAVGADPALGQRLAALRQVREAARAAFADVAREPVPASLIASILAADAASAPPPPRAANAPVWRAAAIAAAVALVVGGVAGTLLGPRPVEMADRLDPLGVARPALARALDRTASGEDVTFDHGTVRLLASYATASGTCRAFTIEGAAPASGLACREGEAWRTRFVVAGPAPSGGFVPASGEEPLLRDLLDRLEAAPLDAAAERAAMARGWR